MICVHERISNSFIEIQESHEYLASEVSELQQNLELTRDQSNKQNLENNKLNEINNKYINLNEKLKNNLNKLRKDLNVSKTMIETKMMKLVI